MPQKKTESRVRRRGVSFLMATALGIGGVALLLWAKMKIVGGVPKTAYAETESDEQAGEANARAGREGSNE